MTACRVRLKVRVSLSIISAEGGEEKFKAGMCWLQEVTPASCVDPEQQPVLTGILAGAVHGCHPGALLAGGGLPQGQVDDVDQSKFLVVPQHVGIYVVVDAHVFCRREENTLNIRPTGSKKGPNGTETLPELATMSVENRGFWSVL